MCASYIMSNCTALYMDTIRIAQEKLLSRNEEILLFSCNGCAEGTDNDKCHWFCKPNTKVLCEICAVSFIPSILQRGNAPNAGKNK